MNATHIHLWITHLPIVGSILGAIALVYGIWTKSDSVKMASFLLLIISSAGGIVAYLTGEEAEETVENIPGITHSVIHEHEQAAKFALGAVIILGILSLLGIYLIKKQSRRAKIVTTIILLFSFFSFSVVARTGYLGGKIRHPEVYQSAGQVNHDEHEEEHEK